MGKRWKKLLAYGVALAMAVASLPTAGTSWRVYASDEVDAVTVRTSSTGDIFVPDSPLAFRDLSAEEIIQETGLGWNLGNTLDAWTGDNFQTGETLWQKKVTTKAFIKSVHDMGFNTIRIPVTWGANINEDYTVSEEWMSRVQEVVDYAIAEDMYVILNVHHDGCLNEAPTPHGWLDVAGTDEEFSEVREKFDGLWETIAERFANYDEHLMFAAMNEVFNGDDNLGWLPEKAAQTEEEMELLLEEAERINELNQDFVDIVRDAGGNNDQRWLVVQPHNTQIAVALDDKFGFEIPSDSAERVMMEIHDYDPFNSKTSMDETKDSSYAGKFAKLKEKYVDQGVPVVVGEYGFTGKAGRSLWYEGVGYLLKKYSMIGCVWDNNAVGDYALVNRDEGKPLDTCVAALLRGFYNVTAASQVVKGTEVIPATEITLDQSEVELAAGENIQIVAEAAAPEGNNDTIIWNSSDSSVASVYNGVIRAKSVGTATITATNLSGSAESTVAVTVLPAELEDPSIEIELEYDSCTVQEGSEFYLDAAIFPDDNGAELIYRSSDETVANVSCDGRVLAKKVGEAVLTISTTDGLEKTVELTVEEAEAPQEYEMELAIHVFYNSGEATGVKYSGTEYSTNTVTVYGDGTYTLKFDCSTDLSDAAKEAGVTNLNNLGSVYIKDYNVTKGLQKKSPQDKDGTVSYKSIKVNDIELLDSPTEGSTAMKGGIFDTGGPLNVWDGSAVAEDKLVVDKTAWTLNFKDIENPTTLEIKFKMSDFHENPLGPVGEEPDETVSPQDTSVPPQDTSVPPQDTLVPDTTVSPDATAPASGQATTVPTTTSGPAIDATSAPELQKGDVVEVAKSNYTITNLEKKTVEYKAPVNKNNKAITVPATITVSGDSYQVTSIAKNAFKNNKKLTKVTIGANIQNIRTSAFQGCKNLKTVIFKTKKLKAIGKNAFKGIHKKAVFKAPKAKYKSYKKLLKKNTGFKKTMKIKK